MRKLNVVLLTTAVIVGCSTPKPAAEVAPPPPAPVTLTQAPPEEATPASAERAMPFDATPVYFAFDSAQLSSDAQPQLKALASHLRDNPALEVTVEGHSDDRGTLEYNLALGEQRAHTVATYLQRLGVPQSRVRTLSYGESRPAVSGDNEDAWAKNRRDEFALRETRP